MKGIGLIKNDILRAQEDAPAAMSTYSRKKTDALAAILHSE